MHQMARKEDFDNLHPEQRDRFIALLGTLVDQRLSCRFEMVGKDMQVVVAQGLASPKLWADKFDVNLDITR
jgi:hypothetical protein